MVTELNCKEIKHQKKKKGLSVTQMRICFRCRSICLCNVLLDMTAHILTTLSTLITLV